MQPQALQVEFPKPGDEEWPYAEVGGTEDEEWSSKRQTPAPLPQHYERDVLFDKGVQKGALDCPACQEKRQTVVEQQ